MSPPANIQRLHTPRTAATVLGEIREARADWYAAIDDAERGDPDADYRASEADARTDALRDEFGARINAMLAHEGLTIADILKATSEALI